MTWVQWEDGGRRKHCELSTPHGVVASVHARDLAESTVTVCGRTFPIDSRGRAWTLLQEGEGCGFRGQLAVGLDATHVVQVEELSGLAHLEYVSWLNLYFILSHGPGLGAEHRRAEEEAFRLARAKLTQRRNMTDPPP